MQRSGKRCSSQKQQLVQRPRQEGAGCVHQKEGQPGWREVKHVEEEFGKMAHRLAQQALRLIRGILDSYSKMMG